MTINADSWQVMSEDEDGTLINVDWTCPNCDFHNYKLMLVNRENAKMIKEEEGFEYDQECEWCNKTIIIRC